MTEQQERLLLAFSKAGKLECAGSSVEGLKGGEKGPENRKLLVESIRSSCSKGQCRLFDKGYL